MPMDQIISEIREPLVSVVSKLTQLPGNPFII